MNQDIKKIIFVGNPVPQHMVESSKVHNVNIADNIAQNTMIEGLYKRYGKNLKVVTVTSDKNVKKLNLGYGVKAETIMGSKIHRIAYYLSITLNYTKKINELLKVGKSANTIIITNGPYIYMALPVMIARLRYGIKWVPFLVGAVEIPEARFPYNLVSKLSRWTTKKVDGVITYVAKSAIDYMPGKPYVEIFYLIEDKLMEIYKQPQLEKNNKFTIAYTGALTNIYNMDIILDVIEKTGNKFRWVFAGVGQNAEKIKSLSENNKFDVNYLGAVSNIEAIKLQRSSHLLLCLRGGDHSRINQYYSKYAASGKLIEYLCSGTPILAGDIPGFSKTIKPFMTCVAEQSSEKIISELDNIIKRYQEKLNIAIEGQHFAFQYFTADYQNDKIYEFLESL